MSKPEKYDYSEISIVKLSENHIDDIAAIWKKQYFNALNEAPELTEQWLNDNEFYNFVKNHLNNNSFTALYNDKVIGFLACDVFDFHNEKTAFFPVMAHTAIQDNKLQIYHKLYSHLAEQLVRQGCLNHMFIFFQQDKELGRYLYELGFGMYLVNAFQDPSFEIKVKTDSTFEIRKAELSDTKDIASIMKEFNEYYKRAPLFLNKDLESEDEIIECISGQDQIVLAAYKDNTLIGFINIRKSNENDCISLIREDTGVIDPLGAYVKPEYRHLGVGRRLVYETFNWAKKQGLKNMHVDFEAANQNAHRFWPKYFKPVLYSVKRRINNDM